MAEPFLEISAVGKGLSGLIWPYTTLLTIYPGNLFL